MALNFSELTTKLRAGGSASAEDIYNIITASPAATFALIEFAAEQRRLFFQNGVEISNLLGNEDMPSPVSTLVEVQSPLDADALTVTILDLAADPDVQRVTLEFIAGEKPLMPMEALRVLAALRLAAPVKSLRLGASRNTALRSLQPLAMHVVDAWFISSYPEHEPRLVFEDLKLVRDAGLVVDGAAGRDLAADYTAHLASLGLADADALAALVLEGADQPAGGCGGNCACGSGGCA